MGVAVCAVEYSSAVNVGQANISWLAGSNSVPTVQYRTNQTCVKRVNGNVNLLFIKTTGSGVTHDVGASTCGKNVDINRTVDVSGSTANMLPYHWCRKTGV